MHCIFSKNKDNYRPFYGNRTFNDQIHVFTIFFNSDIILVAFFRALEPDPF